MAIDFDNQLRKLFVYKRYLCWSVFAPSTIAIGTCRNNNEGPKPYNTGGVGAEQKIDGIKIITIIFV